MAFKDTQDAFPVQIVCEQSHYGVLHVSKLGDAPVKGDRVQIGGSHLEIVSRDVVYMSIKSGSGQPLALIAHVVLQAQEL